jgi:DNA-binding NtrC family response regulator
MTALPNRSVASPDTAGTRVFHAAVTTFKRQLVADALAVSGGNRTAAARALGLQRTYLHRLIRELGVADTGIPAAPASSPR